MKGIVKLIVLGFCISLFTLFNVVNANEKNADSSKHRMWTCETNASSPSDETDKNADETMSKKGKSAKDAFSFAYKHCRDCTKITCSQENQ